MLALQVRLHECGERREDLEAERDAVDRAWSRALELEFHGVPRPGAGAER